MVPAKGAPVKGAAKGGAKAPAPGSKAKKEEVVQPIVEDEYKTRIMPLPENHVNVSIIEYLNHFKQNRLIEVPCPEPDKLGRKRSDSEKLKITQDMKEKKEEQK